MRPRQNNFSQQGLLAYALRLLAARSYSEKRMREKLSLKGESELVQKTIEKLYQLKLLNDREFAENFVSSQRRMKPVSNTALMFKLRQKGVRPEDAAGLLGEDEEGACISLLSKNSRKWDGIAPKLAQQKAKMFLARKGFKISAINKAVSAHFLAKSID